MDFLRLIRSFEDLLFEVLTWLIYYPRTLWMILIHPLRMVDYSDHEQKDSDDEQYTDTLSPPLLLLITLALMHVIEVGFHSAPIKAGSEVVRKIVSSDQNLILLRSFIFGLLPLFAALNHVRRLKLPLERKYLRPPFFGQCYLAAVYALMISLASIIGHVHFPAAMQLGSAGAVAATSWYLAVQTLQLRRVASLSVPRALGVAIWVYVEAVFYFVIVALIIVGGVSL